jgi:hypothetical protein
MALYHLTVKHASRGQGRSALAHALYLAREGPYGRGRFAEQFVEVAHRNMPGWAQDEPQAFWAAADTYERANGRLYTELEIALPRELSPADRLILAQTFVDTHMGTTHPCTWAVHVSRALDGAEQPHVHVMFSERTLDGIERGPGLFFRRANAAAPALGGAAKDPAWNHRDKVVELREAWATTANQALERAGLEVRIDHRSLTAQGIDRTPEPKLGPERTALLRRGIETPESAQILELRAYRARLHRVEQAVERTQGRVIDLALVRAARDARERARERDQAERQAQERERAGSEPTRLTAEEAARVERLLAREPIWRAEQEAARVERLLAQVDNPEARVERLLQQETTWHAAQLEQARQQLERETGRSHTFADTPRVTGRLVDRVELAREEFGRVQDRDDHFVLVPWTRDMVPHQGQSVAMQLNAEHQVTRVLGVAQDRDQRHAERLGTRVLGVTHAREQDLERGVARERGQDRDQGLDVGF